MMPIFHDIVRAVVTDLMLILLLSTMATPRYKSKILYVSITFFIIVGNICANYYLYLHDNYTAVFYVNFAMLIVIGIILKPLFTDKIMQWIFSYITVLNTHISVVFLSYIFRGLIPNSAYSVTILRFILFSLIIIVFRRRVSKLYRNVLDYWHIYMLPIVALLACFMAYLYGGDIKQMLVNNYLPLMCLIFLGLSVYISVMHSLKTITKHYAIREENQKMQAERDFLQLAASGMSHQLELMEKASAQNSRSAHDRRHFNHILLELLEQDLTKDAIELLKNYSQSTPKVMSVFVNSKMVHSIG